MKIVESVTTYEPDNSLKKGYRSLFGEIFNELKNNRWLTYQLFRRDFFALYKQSFIGILWAVILPLVSVGTFIVLNGSGVFNFGAINVPYPIFAVLGMAFWQLFSTGVIASSNSLVSAGPMITKINFSKKALIIAATGQSFVSFLIQFCLVGILLVYYRIVPSIALVLTPVLVIPLIFLVLGLGFILSLLNAVIRDAGNIIAVFVTFVLFLTPVLYAKPTTGFLAYASTYNPLYYLVAVPRDLILTGTTAQWQGFLISSALSTIIFIVCLVAFHLTEARVAERV